MNPMNPISPHVMDVCKIGQGADCCSYLMMGAEGWSCAKNNISVMQQIQKRREAKTMAAMGDNCEGKPDKVLNETE